MVVMPQPSQGQGLALPLMNVYTPLTVTCTHKTSRPRQKQRWTLVLLQLYQVLYAIVLTSCTCMTACTTKVSEALRNGID